MGEKTWIAQFSNKLASEKKFRKKKKRKNQRPPNRGKEIVKKLKKNPLKITILSST